MTLAPVDAQSLRVYSEFTRVDPFGRVVQADRGDDPREILSPALPRNATSGFHLVLEAPSGVEYTLYVGQNPENATQETVYLERYARAGEEWIPDGLEPVTLPYHGKMSTPGIARQTAQGFWLDLRVAGSAPVARIKVEPQVSIGNEWIRYPMEARVVEVAAPAIAEFRAPERPGIRAASDLSARRVLKQKLCGNSEKVALLSPLNIRDFIARDAVQDVAMASATPTAQLWEYTGARARETWCRSDAPMAGGPEWYLRFRDRITGAAH